MKVFNEKTKRMSVVFNEYKVTNDSCPECGRTFKEYDIKRINETGKINCPKCGAKLIR